MILWSTERFGSPSLPCRVGEYRQFKNFPRSGLEIVIKVTEQNQNCARATIEFTDHHGHLVARIENYECVIEPSLSTTFRNNQLHREVLLERR